MIIKTFYPELTEKGKRIDAYLSEQIPELTRSAIQLLIQNEQINVNGIVPKKNYRIVGTETVEVQQEEPRETAIEPENIPIDIVYEDDDIIVVDKPRGMVVHPAAGNWSGTLVNALMYHCGDRLSGINGEIRPGIVHRIDKDTSGLLVVAKNDIAHQSLAAQIAEHSARREYQAIVIGRPREESGTIDKPIARDKKDRKRMAIDPTGRPAVTHYQLITAFRGYSYMAFQLETGRTHQIRVHMASIGHPIIGDPVYGYPKDRFHNIGGQCLHAYRLILRHPTTGKIMTFESELPEYFCNLLRKLPS